MLFLTQTRLSGEGRVGPQTSPNQSFLLQEGRERRLAVEFYCGCGIVEAFCVQVSACMGRMGRTRVGLENHQQSNIKRWFRFLNTSYPIQ